MLKYFAGNVLHHLSFLWWELWSISVTFIAGRNVSVRDHLGHFGWFWGAFRRFERFVVIRLACLGFVNVFMWTELQVSRQVCILQVWYIYMLIIDDLMMMGYIFGLWNVSMVCLFMTRDLRCIVGFVCTESKECLEVFKGQTSKMASSKCSIGSVDDSKMAAFLPWSWSVQSIKGCLMC